MTRKKNLIIVLVLFAIPITCFSIEWIFYSGGLKRIYYFQTFNKDEFRVIEDNNFIFYKKGFSKSYTLNSKYYTSHRILLIPESKSVPIQYEPSGKFLVEIHDVDGLLLRSFTAKEPRSIFREDKDDYYGNHLIYNGKQRRFAHSIFAFELGEIPFDLFRLKWNRLKDLKIKITVLTPDNGLQEYCDKAALVIIPDISF